MKDKRPPRITVDGEEVPAAAVEFELNRLVRFYRGYLAQAEIDKEMDALRERATQQAIGAKLLLNEAEMLALAPDEREIDTRIRRMEQDAGGGEKFRAALANQKLTLDMVRDGIRRGRRIDMLVEKIVAEVPEPTETDLREHFEAHRAEYEGKDGDADYAAKADAVRNFLRHARRGNAISEYVADLREKTEVLIE